ncbi:MAG: ABC transporter substrate-binding protein [Candidatus Schekmanbacteria bacterium]|nr:ABC transporter substrate-binding protein [Candidatus Schekmanbacteria bacterium]
MFGIVTSALRSDRGALLSAMLLCLAVAGAAGSGCRGKPESRLIGAILPLTGAEALYGDSIRKGADLALIEKNELLRNSGTRYILVFRNSRGNAADGEAAYESLNKLGIHVLLGPAISEVAQQVARLVNRDHGLMLTPAATAPNLTKGRGFVFRNAPSDVYEAVAMAVYCQKNELKRIAVLASDSSYGQGLREELVSKALELGIAIAADVRFPAGTSDFSELLDTITAAKPLAIYVPAYYHEIAAILRHAKAKGITAQFLVPASFVVRGVIAASGADAEGVIVAQPDYDPASPAEPLHSFVTAYRKRYGEDPDVFAALSYDAVNMLVATMEISGDRPDEVAQGLRVMKRFPGVMGETQFDDAGDVIKVPKLKRVVNGHLEQI